MPKSVIPSEGWGVLHLFLKVARGASRPESAGHGQIIAPVDALVADGHQCVWFPVLGHKADLGVMVVGPDLLRLQQFQNAILETGFFTLEWSYFSLTEGSEYMSTDDDERRRLSDEEGITDAAEIETRLTVWSERMVHYREQRIHPTLPQRSTICFYPMSKKRSGRTTGTRLSSHAEKN